MRELTKGAKVVFLRVGEQIPETGYARPLKMILQGISLFEEIVEQDLLTYDNVQGIHSSVRRLYINVRFTPKGRKVYDLLKEGRF